MKRKKELLYYFSYLNPLNTFLKVFNTRLSAANPTSPLRKNTCPIQTGRFILMCSLKVRQWLIRKTILHMCMIWCFMYIHVIYNSATPSYDCTYQGSGYMSGESFSHPDGCNLCQCTILGVMCTSNVCTTTTTTTSKDSDASLTFRGRACTMHFVIMSLWRFTCTFCLWDEIRVYSDTIQW